MVFQWAFRPDGTSAFPWVGAGCAALLGLEPSELLTDPGHLWRLVHSDDRAPLKLAMLRARQQGSLLHHICRLTTTRGEARLIEIVASPLPPAGDLWMALALDISEQQRRLSELQQLQQALEQQQQDSQQQARALAEAHAALVRISTIDAPTGLPNRLHFEHSLMRAVAASQRHGRPLVLVCLRLLGMHRHNARSGYLAGDRALQAFADLVAGRLRPGQTAGRLGGVDFAVLLPEVDRAGAVAWLVGLRALFSGGEGLQAPELALGHGLAECEADDTADRLLLRAESMLRGLG